MSMHLFTRILCVGVFFTWVNILLYQILVETHTHRERDWYLRGSILHGAIYQIFVESLQH